MTGLPRGPLALALLLAVGPARASEVDQFTGRDVYGPALADFGDVLDEVTNGLLDRAVELFNRERVEGEGIAEAHHRLVFCVYRATSPERPARREREVPDTVTRTHALLKAGYGPLQWWILTRADPRLVLTVRDNVFRRLPPPFDETDIIKVGGVLLGPDKIDHFFDQGYEYWRVSGDGADDDAARSWGLRSEEDYYGWGASGVFSFADLKANWDGYRFYKGLLDPDDGAFALGGGGTVTRVRDLHWRDWIDWQYDEFLNPCCYTEARAEKIRAVLSDEPETACRTYCAMLAQGAYDMVGGREKDYLAPGAPEGCGNLFDLSWMCSCS